MTKGKSHPKVDAYLGQARKWQGEMKKLRTILLRFPLIEELKWGKPCYSFGKSNVAILIPLKESCALMFCKGALLKDAAGLLLKPGENTQAGRWIKFTSGRDITEKKTILEAYLAEAIEAEKAGLKVKYKGTSDYPVPQELQKKWQESPSFKEAFAALTPGRQRGYFLYFSAPKQSKTRQSRIEKSREKILQGKGFNER